jgi:hypothetical protein
MPSKPGIISRFKIYNTESLRRLGLGAALLFEARRTGIVQPFDVNGSLWYEGAELIEWIKTKPRKSVRQPVSQ